MLEYSGRIQLKKFFNYLYTDSNYYLKRKKENFINCFENYERKN